MSIVYIKKLYSEYKGVILYLFFGVCTTIVNVMSYWIAAHALKMNVMISTIIAWSLAVLFAYVTNRKWVFNSDASGINEILKGIFSFFRVDLRLGLLIGGACLYLLIC